MSEELLIGLAGGAIGAMLTAVLTQAGQASASWGEVALHDEEARERNAQLIVWVDDRTRALVPELQAISDEHNRRNTFHSGNHGAALADAKARALHEFRDEKWRAKIDLSRLRAQEGAWHWTWRTLRRRHAPGLTDETLGDAEHFLERWREPVTRHGTPAVEPLDRTRRTTADAVRELPSLRLT